MLFQNIFECISTVVIIEQATYKYIDTLRMAVLMVIQKITSGAPNSVKIKLRCIKKVNIMVTNMKELYVIKYVFKMI